MLQISFRVLFCVVLLGRAALADEAIPAPLTFEAHVRPILKAHCWHCHGEGEVLKGSLDLRQARRLVRGGDTGTALVPGQSGESLIVERIAAGEMPPGTKKVSAAELATLRAWIDQGSKTARPEPEQFIPESDFTDEERNFWAFRPVSRPATPKVRQTEHRHRPVSFGGTGTPQPGILPRGRPRDAHPPALF
ncbi:MAG: hypothetical protein NT069_02900 [Planctomycetota bacterium]|nr:hypothetical protein [Planctomycetota bacterium]